MWFHYKYSQNSIIDTNQRHLCMTHKPGNCMRSRQQDRVPLFPAVAGRGWSWRPPLSSASYCTLDQWQLAGVGCRYAARLDAHSSSAVLHPRSAPKAGCLESRPTPQPRTQGASLDTGLLTVWASSSPVSRFSTALGTWLGALDAGEDPCWLLWVVEDCWGEAGCCWLVLAGCTWNRT